MKNYYYLLLIIALFAITSCSKKDSTTDPTPNGTTGATGNTGATGTTGTTGTKLASGVYAVGSVPISSSSESNKNAVLWINGIITKLADNASGATAIAVQDNNIYISGACATSSITRPVACYWKNSTLIPLTDGTETTSSTGAMVLKGNDIYMAGYFTPKGTNSEYAVYWKNGTMTKLDVPSESLGSFASGIAIQGADVYICGVYTLPNFMNVACYWKNGVLKTFSDNSLRSMALRVAVNSTDVYIAGYTQTISDATLNFGQTATVWRNGVAVKLTKNSSQSAAYGIALNGSDVYIAGNALSATLGQQGGLYWKNEVPSTITPNDFIAVNILVQGSDVYLIGSNGIKGPTAIVPQYAAYSKNGVINQLSTVPSSSISDIAIIP